MTDCIIRHFIKNDEYLECLFNRPYNPPEYSIDFCEEDFSREYYKLRNQIHEALQIFGKNNNDFSINENRGESRWISIELSTKKLWKSEVLCILKDIISKQADDYILYISHENIQYSLFHILIHKKNIMGYGDCNLLELFGFNKESPSVSLITLFEENEKHIFKKEIIYPIKDLCFEKLTPQQIYTFEYLKQFTNEIEPSIAWQCIGKIKRLYLHDNSIADVSIVSKLKNLESLSIISKILSNLKPLSHLPQLKQLTLSSLSINFNVIQEILNKLVNLQTLEFENIAISNFSFLETICKLERLSFSQCSIETISGFPSMQMLRSIDFYNNNILEFHRMPFLPFLTECYIDNNKLVNTNGLEKSTHLRVLSMRNNQINSFDSISTLKKLIRIDISGNQIKDISPLTK